MGWFRGCFCSISLASCSQWVPSGHVGCGAQASLKLPRSLICALCGNRGGWLSSMRACSDEVCDRTCLVLDFTEPEGDSQAGRVGRTGGPTGLHWVLPQSEDIH